MSRTRNTPGQLRSAPTAVQPHPPAAGRSLPFTWLAVGLIVAVGAAIYANSLSVPFVFDDDARVKNNKTIRQLWPPSKVLGSNRPVAMYSFAINYAIHGTDTRGYHVVNLAIHLAAAAVLFGIVRRTLSRGRPAERYGSAANGLALSVALIWLAHPLQTQSVTYIYQRMESMVGLFYLLTLYTFIRAVDSPRAKGWYAASIACYLLGLGTKEVAVTAPLVVLWYDRALVAHGWRELFRRRWAYYGLLAVPLVLAPVYVLLNRRLYEHGGTLIIDSVTPWQYARSQPGVILHYLRLAFWPRGQCIDYGWPVADTASAILLPSAVLLGLLGLTVWAAFRRPAWGLLGGAFFLILAPSSSVVPIIDLAFEHRMYLPLAALVVAVVIGGYELLTRVVRPRFAATRGNHPPERSPTWRALRAVPVVLCVVALGTASVLRNQVYQDSVTLWRDAVDKAPHHFRTYGNLGGALRNAERYAEAVRCYRIALEIGPNDPAVRGDLALALAEAEPEKLDEAVALCREALTMDPDSPEIQSVMARLMAKQGDFATAEQQYRRAIQADPDNAKTHYNLGNVLADQGKVDEAISAYRRALKLAPDDPEIHNNLATVLSARDPGAAITHYQTALHLDPDYLDAHNNLATVLAAAGDFDGALRHSRRALRIDPEFVPAHANLGLLAARRGDLAGAVAHLEQALRIDPTSVQVHLTLAGLLQRAEPSKAIEHCRAALQLAPESPDAHYQFANSLAAQGRTEQAKAHLREAVRLRPGWPPACRALEVLERDTPPAPSP